MNEHMWNYLEIILNISPQSSYHLYFWITLQTLGVIELHELVPVAIVRVTSVRI